MSEIDWAAIHAGLIAPFDPADVEFRPQGKLSDKGNGLALPYITARAVMDRLDAVVGPENWYGFPDVLIADTAVRVVRYALTIHGITKYAIGDAADTEASKSADSDGIKRGGVPWGIGRYLYALPKEWVRGERAGSGWAIPDAEIERLRAKLGGQAPQRAQQPQERRALREATPTAPTPIRAAAPPAGAVSESASSAASTHEQHNQIRDLVGPAGMTIDALLQTQGMTSLADMSAAKAERVIARLKARAATPDANSPVADTPRLVTTH